MNTSGSPAGALSQFRAYDGARWPRRGNFSNLVRGVRRGWGSRCQPRDSDVLAELRLEVAPNRFTAICRNRRSRRRRGRRSIWLAPAVLTASLAASGATKSAESDRRLSREVPLVGDASPFARCWLNFRRVERRMTACLAFILALGVGFVGAVLNRARAGTSASRNIPIYTKYHTFIYYRFLHSAPRYSM